MFLETDIQWQNERNAKTGGVTILQIKVLAQTSFVGAITKIKENVWILLITTIWETAEG